MSGTASGSASPALTRPRRSRKRFAGRGFEPAAELDRGRAGWPDGLTNEQARRLLTVAQELVDDWFWEFPERMGRSWTVTPM
jgi:hypothetical protein